MSESIPNEFAFGRNELEDCVCPALAAGMNPEGTGDDHIPGLLEAAEMYDQHVRDYNFGQILQNRNGVVNQEEAKKAWISMMETAIKRNFHHAKAAIEVAEELGWVREGEYRVRTA